MTSSILEVDRVRIGYGDLIAVWDASLRVAAGEVCVLRGRNGAGKTTLLSGISGLLATKSGTVMLGGENITRVSAHQRAHRGLSFVQAGKRIFRELSVRENILLGALGGTASRREIAGIVAETCERFPLLSARLNNQAGALSGGQQQLLAIAQALAARPEVLLLDEPSSGLSPAAVGEVSEVIAGLKKEGLAMVVVEELVDDVYTKIADYVVVLDEGRVAIAGSADQISREQMMALLDMEA